MIQKAIKKIPKWTVASFLLFTEVQTQESCNEMYWTSQCYGNHFDDSFWMDFEYLYWKIKDSPAPIPLVYRAPANSVFANLGDPGTRVVMGGRDVPNHWQSGARFSLGSIVDCRKCYGVEASYFFLPSNSYSQTVSSDGSIGSESLRIPFFNIITLKNDSTGLALPGVFSGTATLKIENRMQGVEFNVLARYSNYYCMRVTALGGLRYWNFKEDLTFDTSSPFVIPPIDIYQTKDQFNTENNFYGGQIGLLFAYNCGRFFLDAKGKFAVGAICGRVLIDGYLLTNDYNNFMDVQKFSGGYFALPSDIGKHYSTKLSVFPEINFNFGYQLSDNMQIKLGYSCLYVTKVLWATQQIDDNINGDQATTYTNSLIVSLGGQQRPGTLLKTEDLWIQGLNISFVIEF